MTAREGDDVVIGGDAAPADVRTGPDPATSRTGSPASPIGVVAATATGRSAAASLAAAWPGEVRIVEADRASDALREAWRSCAAVVSFLAVGATVRVLAPLLGDKTTDPAVVCVDESVEFAVAVLGGHHGANRLARRVSGVLGCRPVVTTASDQAGVTPLDSYGADLGFTVADPAMLAPVGAAVLSGEPVLIEGADGWPLPALPPNVTPDAASARHRIVVTDAVVTGSADGGLAAGRAADAGDAANAHDGAVRYEVVREADKAGKAAAGDAFAAEHAESAKQPAEHAESPGLVEHAESPGLVEHAGLAERARPVEPVANRNAAEEPAEGTDGAGRSGSEGGADGRPAGHGGRAAVQAVPARGRTLVYRPPSLVVGVGSARGVSGAEVGALIDAALAAAGLAPASVRCVATADIKAGEAGILRAAADRGWDVVTHPAGELAAVAVPNPSDVVRAEVGTPSVAEAAALLTARRAGRDAALVVEKRKSANATVAVARLTPRGRLSIVGLGPGARDLLTPRAVAALQRASVVVGLDQYLEQVRDLIRPGARVIASGLGREEERARAAVAEASAGHAVALVGSGDAGVYAMASPALEFADADVDVDGVPGITAAVAASALLGAPLGHDHAYVSLSDLHTPWEVIERRITAAAEGDFTLCLYNPRSRARDWQLPKALAILAAHRPPETPVGYVRNASRPGQTVALTTIAAFDPAQVDMFTVVIVGSSRSRAVAGRFVTPRGYRWA